MKHRTDEKSALERTPDLAAVRGATDLASRFPTVVHMLHHAVLRAPASEALVCGRRRLTYAQLGCCVAELASHLLKYNATGCRVVVMLPNSLELVVAAHAVHAARAQLTLLNPDYSERELGAILEDADALLVLTDHEGYQRNHTLFSRYSSLTPLILGTNGWDIASSKGHSKLPSILPAADELAVLQYTGGTTGRSKGVVVRHGAWMLNIVQRATLLPHRMDAERFLAMTPLFHAYAIASALYPALYSCGTLVILPRYHPEQVLRLVAEERITYFPGLPTIYTGLLGYSGLPQADLSTLKICVSGAAPLPAEVHRRWESRVGVTICEGYGLTEATAVLTYNPLYGRCKTGSVGIPLPQTEIQVVDLTHGTKVLARGQVGEVRARGPQLMDEYRNLPNETSEILRDGWLYTGDIGELDEDGYLFLRDRKKQMAIVGGYNVFPREIEEVLHLHPDVQEAAAVSQPHEYLGEVVVALVRLRPDAEVSEEKLLTHCASKLVKYKVPAAIRAVGTIPKTGAGKTDHKRVKAEWAMPRGSK